MALKKRFFLIQNTKGQSSIEFIFTFIFSLTLVFLFVRLALNFASGYLAHYSTFMASRAFLSHDNALGNINSVVGNSKGGNPNSASGMGKRTFKKYKVKLVGLDEKKLNFNLPLSGKLTEFIGATFTFEKPLSSLKLISGGAKLNFLTESFIGKEPPRATCYTRTCWAMRESDGASCDSSELHVTLFDNGC
jgi:hypothetical protein